MKMKIGDRIRYRREELGLSQEELAKKLGYKSRSSINKIEKDASGLPQNKIAAIAKALDTSPTYIMGWDADPEETSKKIDATVDVITRMEKDVTFSGLVFKLNELEPEKLKRIAAIIDASIAAL